ncbi:MAG TPA: TerC/Alx family metal homeostasis membrane protein [Gaiellales bacterium]
MADWWQWTALAGAACMLLALDLRVLRPASLRGAALVSAWWLAAGAGFAGVVWAWRGQTLAGEYLAGYAIERSLSLDNVFVFVVALEAFAVPAQVRAWVVGWAIGAALALRAVFILAGSALLGAADWTTYVFAAFLVLAGLRLARKQQAEADPARSRVVRAIARVVPTVPGYAGRRLAVRRDGRLHATPLLAVLLVLAATDLVFAADSIPSIFAVTRDAEIVFAANVMALVGLPSLFVLLEGLRHRFVHLNVGLAAVLVLTGVEMAAADLYHPPAWATLLAVAGLIGAAVAASLRSSRGPRPTPSPHLEEEPC